MKKYIPYVTIGIMILINLYFQLMAHNIIIGSDTLFHFNRFYDTEMQIKQAKLSYFQMNYAFKQSGRIVNAVYGPYFAYINGLILLITKNWFRYQIYTTILIYLIGGIGIYKLIRRFNKSIFLNSISIVIFLSMGWITRWQVSQNLTAWGAALAPYVINCGIDMLENKENNYLKLAIIMSIAIETHLLSSLIFVITLIPFFIIRIVKKRKRGKFVISIIKSVLLTLLLTCNYWWVLLRLSLTNNLAQPAAFNMTNNTLRFIKSIYLQEVLIPSFILLVILQLIYILIINRSEINLYITLIGTGFLILGSRLFIWDKVQKNFPIIARDFQFPDRLSIVIYPLFLTAFVIALAELKNKRIKIICSCILLITAITSVVMTTNNIRYYTNRGIVDKHVITLKKIDLEKASHSDKLAILLQGLSKRSPDYLPLKSKVKRKDSVNYEKEILDNTKNYDKDVLKDGTLKLMWHAKKFKNIILPVVLYKQSRLIVNNKVISGEKKSIINVPRVYQRRGSNIAKVKFMAPVDMVMSINISIVSWIILFCVTLIRLYRRKFAIMK